MGTLRDRNSAQKSSDSPLGPKLGASPGMRPLVQPLVSAETNTGANHADKVQKARREMLARVVPLQLSPGNDTTQRNIIQA